MGEISMGLICMGLLIVVMFAIGLVYYIMSKAMDTIVSYTKSFIKFHVMKRRYKEYWDDLNED